MTLITGYLGAGKTTLVNHLLRQADGCRLMVFVNDFGDISIDAELIESQDADTLRLANGCICCSIAGDLYNALSDVLDRSPRPDHLIIEASGVADPKRIADVALAEPDMRLDGIVALVSAPSVRAQLNDAYIADSILRQLKRADLFVLNKIDLVEPAELQTLKAWLSEQYPLASQVAVAHGSLPVDLVLGRPSYAEPVSTMPPPGEGHRHDSDHEDQYLRWSYREDESFSLSSLQALPNVVPASVLRLKGVVRLQNEGGWAVVQMVGRRLEVKRYAQTHKGERHSVLSAIGLRRDLDADVLREAIKSIASRTAVPD